MNNLARIDTMNLTMSSMEVAALTGKDHKNIIRDIRAMLIGLYGEDYVERIVPEHYRNRHSEFVRENADAILTAICGDGSKGSHQDQRGFSWERDVRGYITSFQLDKTHSMTLVSGYIVKLRKKIIDRWIELESVPQADPMAALSDPMQLRTLLLGYSEKVIALEHKVSEQAPKVEALDRLATKSDGAMCITDAAKHLQMQPKKLFRWLHAHHWIFRRAGGAGWIAYQDRIKDGFMEHKITTVERGDGTEKVCEQALITAKGLGKLAMVVAV